MIGFYLLMGIIFIVSIIASERLKRKFRKYSKIAIPNGMTGRDIAEKMLRDSNIRDVRVISVEGQLTDHYNPLTKTVNLSRDVYEGNNIAAAAIAAHECGHAVQHATAYTWLNMRSRMVPAVSFASNWVQWVILAGILTITIFPFLLMFGILLFAFTTVFSFITLPVEIDASNRALAWLSRAGVTNYDTHSKAEDALRAAGYTYVVAALGSLATLLYYVISFFGND